jgi:flagellar hook assembly protein FlgD
VARIASTVLVVALLAATAAAFALTQGLKLQKSPIFGTDVERVFSPICACDRGGGDRATIEFKLREADRIDVEIVDGDRVVRTVERGRSYPRGPVTVEWDGRDDAGEVLPEGEYRPRVRLRDAHQTITLPNPIRIDVTPPTVQDVSVLPPVISPDGDGRADRLVVRYRLNEPGRGILFVDGKQRVLTRFHRTDETIRWNGKVRGRVVQPGAYTVQVTAFDPAGNLAEPAPPVQVTLRYVALGRNRITVAAGSRFAVRVSSDAARVRWSLGGRSGSAPPGTLRLRAPLQKGQFTLTVTANGRAARAAVFVREPSR